MDVIGITNNWPPDLTFCLDEAELGAAAKII